MPDKPAAIVAPRPFLPGRWRIVYSRARTFLSEYAMAGAIAGDMPTRLRLCEESVRRAAHRSHKFSHRISADLRLDHTLHSRFADSKLTMRAMDQESDR
jgi:hypothetical protein